MTTLLLAGATGLVGQAVLRQVLENARVARVVAPTCRPLPRRSPATRSGWFPSLPARNVEQAFASREGWC